MSLSRPKSRPKPQGRPHTLTGKVLMGVNTPGPDEMTIQEIEGKRQLTWDDATNEEYLNRVRQKARDAAKEIKLLAELEAEALRATSTHEGFNEGLAQAQEFVDQHIRDISAKAENLFRQLGAQGSTIYEERRGDIVELIKLAVRKTLKVELSEKRIESLDALMRQALDRLDSKRELTVRCHPDDVEELEQFLAAIQERDPALKYWSVKADPAIETGGVIVEGAGCRVDNTIATRWEAVEPIFDQLAEQVVSGDEG
ncbi:MAG: flagellar assembly protein FliH [Desulfovibrionaceae bacterium]|nr:flagellar assembly protein FliH [Desulfovibrionaceae bacterium]